MAIARNMSRVWTYTLVEDRELVPDPKDATKEILGAPKKDATAWTFRMMSERLASRVADMQAGEGSRSSEILRSCLVGHENYRDHEGVLIPYVKGTQGGATDDLLDRLTARQRIELAAEVWAQSNVPPTLGN